MTKKWYQGIMSSGLCLALIVAVALFTSGCNGSTGSGASSGTQQETKTDENAGTDQETKTDENAGADQETKADENTGTDSETGTDQEAGQLEDGSVLGEGKTVFVLTIEDGEGVQTKLEIHTDKETVGEALSELGVIEGEEGEYGLYITAVNGITADYDKDGMYWAFYINDEYAQTGVDSTPIKEGDSYSLKMEKG